MQKWTFLLILSVSFGALAASPYKRALDKKVEAYLQEGVFVGGRAGKGFALTNVRRDLSTKLGMERVILDISDIDGQPLEGHVGFFHVNVEKNPPRVVIDLAQVSQSAVTEAKLKKLFRKSPYIKKVELTSDPEDNSASLVLAFKDPMAVEVFEMPNHKKSSRLVIDLKSLARKVR